MILQKKISWAKKGWLALKIYLFELLNESTPLGLPPPHHLNNLPSQGRGEDSTYFCASAGMCIPIHHDSRSQERNLKGPQLPIPG